MDPTLLKEGSLLTRPRSTNGRESDLVVALDFFLFALTVFALTVFLRDFVEDEGEDTFNELLNRREDDAVLPEGERSIGNRPLSLGDVEGR